MRKVADEGKRRSIIEGFVKAEKGTESLSSLVLASPVSAVVLVEYQFHFFALYLENGARNPQPPSSSTEHKIKLNSLFHINNKQTRKNLAYHSASLVTSI